MQALYIINKTELIRHNHLEGFFYVLNFKNFRLYSIHVWMSLNYILYLIPILLEIKDNPFNILSLYVWLLGVWNFMSKNYFFVWEIWVKSLNLTDPTYSLKPKKKHFRIKEWKIFASSCVNVVTEILLSPCKTFSLTNSKHILPPQLSIAKFESQKSMNAASSSTWAVKRTTPCGSRCQPHLPHRHMLKRKMHPGSQPIQYAAPGFPCCMIVFLEKERVSTKWNYQSN